MLHTLGLPALRNEHWITSADRGQLSTYLRPMGAKVPPLYGPSHDTGGFTGGRAPPSGT